MTYATKGLLASNLLAAQARRHVPGLVPNPPPSVHARQGISRRSNMHVSSRDGERSLRMPRAAAFLLAAALGGCVWQPVELRSAPEPSPPEIVQLRSIAGRTLAVKAETVFPRVIYLLMDYGYVVRAADKDLGFLSLYQQWNDASQGDATITLEGTVMFRPAGADRTEVRLLLTSSWQRQRTSGGGGEAYPTVAMVSAVQQNATPGQYKTLLDILERGLTSPAR